MLTLVTLHGHLAEAAGAPEWTLDVQSPGEALRAIECQHPGLAASLLQGDKNGLEYRVLCDGRDVAGSKEIVFTALRHYARIDFIPVPAGAGLGLWEAIAGVVLVVVGIILIETPFGAPLIIAGIGLIAGGAMSMFFGPKPPVVPKHTSDERGDDPSSQSSYLFTGPVNTVSQGGPVPLLYGRMIVGSQVISQGIRTVKLDVEGDDQSDDELHDQKKDALNTAGTVTKIQRDDD